MVDFGDEEQITEENEPTINQLVRTKQVRVYHSSSDEDEEEIKPRSKVWTKTMRLKVFYKSWVKHLS